MLLRGWLYRSRVPVCRCGNLQQPRYRTAEWHVRVQHWLCGHRLPVLRPEHLQRPRRGGQRWSLHLHDQFRRIDLRAMRRQLLRLPQLLFLRCGRDLWRHGYVLRRRKLLLRGGLHGRRVSVRRRDHLQRPRHSARQWQLHVQRRLPRPGVSVLRSAYLRWARYG